MHGCDDVPKSEILLVSYSLVSRKGPECPGKLQPTERRLVNILHNDSDQSTNPARHHSGSVRRHSRRQI